MRASRIRYEDPDGDGDVIIRSQPGYTGIDLEVIDDLCQKSISVPLDRRSFAKFLRRALKKLEEHGA